MGIKDLLFAPIFLIFIYSIVYWIKTKSSDKYTKKYLVPALTLKLIGGIGVGLIYFFYYGNGDTVQYYKGSILLNKIFENSSRLYFETITSTDFRRLEIYPLVRGIYLYQEKANIFIINLAAFFGLLSSNSYSFIAIGFALLSLTGVFSLFNTFTRIYPMLHKQFAIACFFIPSLFFWGSGVMKDTIAVGALGWTFTGFYHLFINRNKIILSFITLVLSLHVLLIVKAYIAYSFLPPALFWVFIEYNGKIKNGFLRMIAKPFFIISGMLVGYFGFNELLNAGLGYSSIEDLTYRANYQAYHLSTYQSGSNYNIGRFDGTISSFISLSPKAIYITLFRPFIWESRNIIQVFSAIESSFFLGLTVYVFFKKGILGFFQELQKSPLATFCLTFSLIFSVIVGLTSGNFGTLVRYKIPLIPFYISSLYIILYSRGKSLTVREN